MEYLVSSLAHEIRNPLGMMNLYAEIIRKNIQKLKSEIDDEEELQKSIDSMLNATDMISDSSVNLEKILSCALEYSKPLTLDLKEENPVSLIKENIELLSPLYDKEKVKIAFSYEISDFKLNIDKVRFSQCVINLLKNALEASGEGKRVEVELCSSRENVSIKVKDQGSGVKAENTKKIFTPYFTTKEKGSGIGLAESKRIIEAHGGKLNLLETSECGSIFEIELRGNTRK